MTGLHGWEAPSGCSSRGASSHVKRVFAKVQAVEPSEAGAACSSVLNCGALLLELIDPCRELGLEFAAFRAVARAEHVQSAFEYS